MRRPPLWRRFLDIVEPMLRGTGLPAYRGTLGSTPPGQLV
jgi:hypothetical protein